MAEAHVIGAALAAAARLALDLVGIAAAVTALRALRLAEQAAEKADEAADRIAGLSKKGKEVDGVSDVPDENEC